MYILIAMDPLNSSISVDCVVFGFDTEQLKVLLIERNKSPYEKSDLPSGTLKLPGGLIKDTDDLEKAAYRILKELTGLDHVSLKQFAIFDRPDRLDNPNDLTWLCSTSGLQIRRVITITYYSILRIAKNDPAKMLLSPSHWIPIKKLPRLAFDHNFIISGALKELRKKLQFELFGLELLPKKFTLRQFQNLYSEILDREFDKRNFRKKVQKLDYLIPLPEKEKKVKHKPAQLYKLDKKKLSKPERLTFF